MGEDRGIIITCTIPVGVDSVIHRGLKPQVREKRIHFISLLTYHIISQYPDGKYYLKKPVDSKFFDGTVEGEFTFADKTATQLQFFGGTYTSGGASGTWTLSGSSKPNAVSLVFQNVTNGITSTYRIYKAY